MKLIFVLLLTMLVASAAPDMAIRIVGKLDSRSGLTETSGIAASIRDSSVLWGINDSGNAPLLHAFSVDGTDLGHVRVKPGRNIDWEDLASFAINDESYLMIADTGDNSATRRYSWLLIVKEPLADDKGKYSGDVDVVARVPFLYEDGPRDCEAVAVDVASDRVLLVSKRDVPAGVYELPLTLVHGIRRPLVARKIATLDSLPRPTLAEILQAPLLGPWRHQPTAIDIARDGRHAAVITYQNLYLFHHAADENWGRSLTGMPQKLALPELSQTESVAFVDDRVIVIAEGRSVPLLSIGPISY